MNNTTKNIHRKLRTIRTKVKKNTNTEKASKQDIDAYKKSKHGKHSVEAFSFLMKINNK